MTINQIREKACLLGVNNYSRLRKADLIRAIQVKEGNSPGYQAITCDKIVYGSRVALVKQQIIPEAWWLEPRSP